MSKREFQKYYQSSNPESKSKSLCITKDKHLYYYFDCVVVTIDKIFVGTISCRQILMHSTLKYNIHFNDFYYQP